MYTVFTVFLDSVLIVNVKYEDKMNKEQVLLLFVSNIMAYVIFLYVW